MLPSTSVLGFPVAPLCGLVTDGCVRRIVECRLRGSRLVSAKAVGVTAVHAEIIVHVQHRVAMKIVLASESPFRKQAMDMLRIAYETCPAAIDEKATRHD